MSQDNSRLKSNSKTSLDIMDDFDNRSHVEINLPPPAHPVVYLPGEVTIEHAKGVRYIDQIDPHANNENGTLELTNFKIVFYMEDRDHAEPGKDNRRLLVQVPLGTLSKINANPKSSQLNEYGVEFYCKDFRNLRFVIKNELPNQRSIIDLINQYAFPAANIEKLFAFTYGKSQHNFVKNGWDVYKSEEEYHRQNIFTNGWRISKVNSNYKLIDSYPAVLAVPNTVSDDDIVYTSPHRHMGRVPVLSWLHPESKASITRCGQPLVGNRGRRNQPDEEYVKKIRLANANANNLYIFDTRTQVNAFNNREKDGGMENPGYYEMINYVFFNIQNTHAMRESQRKLQEVCFPRPDDARWFYNLDQTKWLTNLRQILFAAASVADKVENNKTSVLVHCTDGCDFTPQVTSLAMLMLDPYYRTICGFECLIEKEWCSFGHKFALRTGHGERSDNDNQRSPIFLQFIDCVWQLTEQFQHAFEFNAKLLITILDHLYSCQFGTFLYNSEQERYSNNVAGRTISLWSYVNSALENYRNPLYTPAEVSGYRVIIPQCQLPQLRLWTDYYIRWNPKLRCQEPVALQDKQLIDIMANFHKLLAERKEKTHLPTSTVAATTTSSSSPLKIKK